MHTGTEQNQEQQIEKGHHRQRRRNLLCALAECAYNILKKNIPLSELQRRRLSKYRTKLRELAQRRTPAARRRQIVRQQQVGEGQSGGFLSAFLAPLASSVFLPLLREVLLKR